MSLYLYRHGETEENKKHILQGCMPGVLTPEGRQQITDSVEHLSTIPFTCILCSDLQRCRDTEAIINSRLHLPVVFTQLLRERDWGSATGMIVDGVTKIRIPDDAETMQQVKERAQTFLQLIQQQYPTEIVLTISHGLFLRCLQAVYYHKDIKDILPMHNTELRLLIP